MSAEIIAFLITVVSLVIMGIPAIKSNISLPAHLDLKDVDEADLTGAQRNAFALLDPVFGRLKMQPRRTFRAVNLLARNINRLYYGTEEPVAAIATFMTYGTQEGTETVQNYVEFITEYADGTELNTKNITISGLFVPKPKHINQIRPGLKDIEALKKVHDRRSPQASSSPRLSLNLTDLFNKMQQEHTELCERQRRYGLLRLDPVTGKYHSTTRMALKGIRNFLNPFADNFSWVKLILAVIFTAGLSCTAGLAFGNAGSQTWLSPVIPIEGMNSWFARWVLLILAYAVSGAVLGFILEHKAFIWGFLMGCLPLIFIPGSVSWWYPMILSTAAAVVCGLRQMNRKVV